MNSPKIKTSLVLNISNCEESKNSSILLSSVQRFLKIQKIQILSTVTVSNFWSSIDLSSSQAPPKH